jgi:ribosomal-protein-alanine N-acetyltransferase
MIILETRRMLLRPFSSGDFDAVHSYASSPENVKYMIWGPNNEQATKIFLAECEKKWAEEPVSEYEFAIVLKETGNVIGGCGIYLNKERYEAMLGWILHRDYWKRGLMPEAASALLGFGFGKLGLHRIYAICNAENYGSYRVMEKIGMRREAHFIKNRYGRAGEAEKWYDEYHYAILSEEWRKLNAD